MIRSIFITQNVASEYGLQAATFRNLGRRVVLSGPNGGGKTRYLKALKHMVKEMPRLHKALETSKQSLERTTEQIADNEHAIQYCETAIQNLTPRLAASQDRVASSSDSSAHEQKRAASELASIEDELRGARHALPIHEQSRMTLPADAEAFAQEIRDLSDVVQCFKTTEPGNEPTLTFVELSPLRLPTIEQDQELSSAQKNKLLVRSEEPGLTGPYAAIDVYLSKIAGVLWDGENPKYADTASLRNAEAFNAILEALIGGTVEPHFESGRIVAYLGGLPFAPDKLSEGERVLIAWSIALHTQGGSLSNSIILLDEPELHLHPNACVLAIERLLGGLGEHAQLWIATHSVPLVAYAGLENIYYVNSGKSRFAGERIPELMESLLGGPDGRRSLRTFIDDADAVACARFLAQCLVEPEVVDTSKDDPQKRRFARLVEAATRSGQRLRVLDYGAGKARLAAALADLDTSRLEYFAYEPNAMMTPEKRREALENVATVRQAQTATNYLLEELPPHSQEDSRFDVIVTCNVFHEISPIDWLTTLSEIHGLLRENGLLWLMEDLLPSVGEMPHALGYVMLDEQGLRHLCDSSEDVSTIASDRDGRLVVVQVPRFVMSRATKASRRKTLEQVVIDARSRLPRLRQLEPSAYRGRLHAHYAIQLVNAELALHALND